MLVFSQQFMYFIFHNYDSYLNLSRFKNEHGILHINYLKIQFHTIT